MAKRKNARYLRAKKAIKQIRIGTRRLARLTEEKRGAASEDLASQMIRELINEGKLLESPKVERCSWMDCVRRIDGVVIRLSGKPIPLQFKSSSSSVARFKEAYKIFFIKRLGAFPVVIDFPPGMTDWDQKKKVFLKFINNWNGRFVFEEWELNYSIFFNFENFPEFGSLRNRIKLFLRFKKTN